MMSNNNNGVTSTQSTVAGSVPPQTVLVFTLDKETYTVNGEPKTLDTKVVSIEGRAMLPARFVAEILGGTVDWNPQTREVTITYASGGTPKPAVTPTGGPAGPANSMNITTQKDLVLETVASDNNGSSSISIKPGTEVLLEDMDYDNKIKVLKCKITIPAENRVEWVRIAEKHEAAESTDTADQYPENVDLGKAIIRIINKTFF